MNRIIAVVVAVACGAVGGFLLARNITPPLRGAAGPEVTSQQFFKAGLVEEGTILNVTASTTLTAAQVCSLSFVKMSDVNVASVLTLPTANATNDLCLPTIGATKTFTAFNDATSTLTFTAGTGDRVMQSGSGTKSITAAQTAKVIITRIRTASTTFQVLVGE